MEDGGEPPPGKGGRTEVLKALLAKREVTSLLRIISNLALRQPRKLQRRRVEERAVLWRPPRPRLPSGPPRGAPPSWPP